MIRRLTAAALAAITLALPAFAQERFTATITGQGPDIILIPGLASSKAVWDATVKQLAAKHRVHALQVKGFAGEPAGPNAEGPVLAPLIEEVAAYAGKLEKPAIIGHSIGGLIALEVAAKQPKVDRIMVVDALPFYSLLFGPQATVEMVKPQATMMRTQITAMSDAQFAAGQDRSVASLVKTESASAAPKEWSLKSDRKVVGQAMYEDMLDDARPLLPKIRAKTTVLYAYDPAMGRPASVVDGLYTSAYAGLQGAQLRRIDGGFHFIMLDQPEAFATEVAAFLK
jgi:pimeloyl-ACP methyl ester carboxylesterase